MSWVAIAAGVVSVVAGGVASSKGVPGVAEFKPVNPQDEQTKAIEGNISQLENVGKLSSGVTDIATKNLLTSLNQIQPGYSDMSGKVSTTINSYLAGQLPQDVIDQVKRTSAEAGILGGYGPDSGMGRSLTARDLGLNTLSLVDRGLSAAQSWMAQTNSMAPKFDFTNMFITPAQQIETSVENNRGIQNQQQQQMNMAAKKAAVPWATLSGVAGVVAGGYGGGGGGIGSVLNFAGGGGGSSAPASTFAGNSSSFSLTPQQQSLSNTLFPMPDLTAKAGFYGRG